ncbi:Ankyrin repeat domain-containing protein 50 [Penaeus vannamei]|uniref:Ankyrin repeat domain-containing protein 50 n=1 Tax=Penaeus vannamei TaxID=6689 RepID=A0A423SIT3_PENVA|nr:Ankyrin repeat domain-containing protein 50 [Penaeus vannamei]
MSSPSPPTHPPKPIVLPPFPPPPTPSPTTHNPKATPPILTHRTHPHHATTYAPPSPPLNQPTTQLLPPAPPTPPTLTTNHVNSTPPNQPTNPMILLPPHSNTNTACPTPQITNNPSPTLKSTASRTKLENLKTRNRFAFQKQAREAARAGDVRRVREVLRRGFGIETEFQEAANRGPERSSGHSALVALLMQENAHVNASTKDGMTPLHLASWGGHAEVIGVLLAKRADGNAKTTEGMTAIHLAGMGGHVSSMEALTPACDILSVTREGKSALHLAAEYGNLGAVQWLLLQGLDASIRDKKGWTPRQYAKDEGHRKVVEVLEKLEKQRLPQGFAQQQKIVKDLQEKLQARETEINRLNRQQAMKDRIQERAQAQIKNELQEMRETLRAQSEMIVRLQSTMLTKAEPGKETQVGLRNGPGDGNEDNWSPSWS